MNSCFDIYYTYLYALINIILYQYLAHSHQLIMLNVFMNYPVSLYYYVYCKFYIFCITNKCQRMLLTLIVLSIRTRRHVIGKMCLIDLTKIRFMHFMDHEFMFRYLSIIDRQNPADYRY